MKKQELIRQLEELPGDEVYIYNDFFGTRRPVKDLRIESVPNKDKKQIVLSDGIPAL